MGEGAQSQCTQQQAVVKRSVGLLLRPYVCRGSRPQPRHHGGTCRNREVSPSTTRPEQGVLKNQGDASCACKLSKPPPRAAHLPHRDGAASPLFDLPDEAVELVLSLVDSREEKRALRLVCKRTCASVDSRVVAVDGSRLSVVPVCELQLSALIRAPWQLLRLDLSNRKLGPAGASLATALWPSLRELCLNNNRLGEAGTAALAAARWPALQKLRITSNSLGDAGAASLAAARWPALQELWLNRNPLGPSSGAALAAAHWPALRELRLSANNLGDAGAASLEAGRWPALQALHLAGTRLGDAGAASLAAAHFPALQQLYLHSNFLGPAGAAALASARWHALQVVDISANQLGNAGAAALAITENWPALQFLYIISNGISKLGMASLRAHWPTAMIA